MTNNYFSLCLWQKQNLPILKRLSFADYPAVLMPINMAFYVAAFTWPEAGVRKTSIQGFCDECVTLETFHDCA